MIRIRVFFMTMVWLLASAAMSRLSAADAYSLDYAKANAAYRAGDYQQAIKLYEQLYATSPSAEVCYNLGNALFRTEDNTHALLWYERAQKMMPGNEDISHNIDIARAKTTDNLPADGGSLLLEWYRRLLTLLSVDGWAYVGIASLIIAILSFVLYISSTSLAICRTAFSLAALMAILTILSNLFAWQEKRLLTTHDTGIIINSSADIFSSPSLKAGKAFELHDGSKLHITDDGLDAWYGIRLSDGREGWVERKNIELL